MSADPIACLHCGQPLRMGTPAERTPSSAWIAPDATDPAACIPSAPGHTPADPPEMDVWAVYDDGEEFRLGLVPGPHARMEAARLAALGWQDCHGQTTAGRRIRYEVRAQ